MFQYGSILKAFFLNSIAHDFNRGEQIMRNPGEWFQPFKLTAMGNSPKINLQSNSEFKPLKRFVTLLKTL